MLNQNLRALVNRVANRVNDEVRAIRELVRRRNADEVIDFTPARALVVAFVIARCADVHRAVEEHFREVRE